MLQEDNRLEVNKILSAHFTKGMLEDGAELMYLASCKQDNENNILSKGKIHITSSFIEFAATDGTKLFTKRKAVNKTNFKDGFLPDFEIEFLVNAAKFKTVLAAAGGSSTSLLDLALERRSSDGLYLSLGSELALKVDSKERYPNFNVLTLGDNFQYEFLTCISKEILQDALACVGDDTVAPYLVLRFGADEVETNKLNVVTSPLYIQDGLELRAGRDLKGAIMPIKPNERDLENYTEKLKEFRENNIFWSSSEFNSSIEFFNGLLKLVFFGRKYQYNLQPVDVEDPRYELIGFLRERLKDLSTTKIEKDVSQLDCTYVLAILASMESRLALAGVEREDVSHAV